MEYSTPVLELFYKRGENIARDIRMFSSALFSPVNKETCPVMLATDP